MPSKIEYTGEKQDEVKAELERLGYEYTSFENVITVVGKSVNFQNVMKL